MVCLKKVIVIGFDGFEPRIAERMLRSGKLPNLARLRQQGGYARIATTAPAQTPVAWSTFATGLNPGGHGIFDFLRRNPNTYLPELALNRYEQKNAFLPPKVINLRRGRAVWDVLSEAGIPSVVLRCPCTYPPDETRGRMLSGMGVPDLRGSLGTSTFYTSAGEQPRCEGESTIAVQIVPGGTAASRLLGPLSPRTRRPVESPITIELAREGGKAVIRSAGQPRALPIDEGRWSDWLRVKFKIGVLKPVRGMVRFYLVRTEPVFELYASPINYDPAAPQFAISSPPGYAKDLAATLGTFYTAGMVEDHNGLINGRIDEAAFLDQCEQVLGEREAMMHHELDRLDEGLLFCLFDTPDRIHHMFWRFTEPEHPANRVHAMAPFERVIEEDYRRCDRIVGDVLGRTDNRTLLAVLSDHGCGSFRRGVHLNTWLFDRGLLALKGNRRPGDDGADMLRSVDWSRTKAYALGLGGIYLNLRGREAEGIVDPAESETVKAELAGRLAGLKDTQCGTTAVRRVVRREDAYCGPYTREAPDLLVYFASGYRASWDTATGSVPEGQFEDNTRRWAGDHIIDPELTPGVLFMNRPFPMQQPRLLDMAPTILRALGVAKTDAMEGKELLS